jgi:2-iminoacetate synthase ThiH
MARLLLHPYIPNIQTSWVKLGTEGAAEMLRSGANDLGGPSVVRRAHSTMIRTMVL